MGRGWQRTLFKILSSKVYFDGGGCLFCPNLESSPVYTKTHMRTKKLKKMEKSLVRLGISQKANTGLARKSKVPRKKMKAFKNCPKCVF